MKRLFCILSLIVFFFSSCKHHSDLPEPAPQKSKRTVIVYMMAENSLSPYAPSDSAEIAYSAHLIPDSVNFIVYKDGVEYPVIYTVTKKEGFRPWKKYTRDQNSTDSLVMNDVFQLITRNFSAEKYDLVLWSHGSGWIPRKESSSKTRTIGIDNGLNSTYDKGNKMNISELRWAIDQNFHLEYILFDACFMQSVEVAYELRNSTDYLIGSPAEIPGDGAPYDQIMNELCSGNAIGIATNYYHYYERRNGVALSVIDGRQMEHLAQESRPYIQKIWENKKVWQTNSIQSYAPFCENHSWEPEPFDIRCAMHRLLDTEDYEAWNQTFEQAVVFHEATYSWSTVFPQGSHNRLIDESHYSGVGMFIPSTKYDPYLWNYYFRNTEWYQAAGWESTGW